MEGIYLIFPCCSQHHISNGRAFPGSNHKIFESILRSSTDIVFMCLCAREHRVCKRRYWKLGLKRMEILALYSTLNYNLPNPWIFHVSHPFEKNHSKRVPNIYNLQLLPLLYISQHVTLYNCKLSMFIFLPK